MKNSKSGADTETDDDHTLAHRASASGDTQLVIRAIKQDPSAIQQKDAEGYTPLAHAVMGKHFQAMKRLIKMGADVNVQDAQGRTCLSVAAYQGWSDGVVYLLRKGARQNIVDKSGRTPLHAATYDTDTRSLLALMKRLSPTEINVGDNERMTALHWAAFHNRPEHVRQLLQRGAQPIQHDVDGKTPLHWAAQNGSSTCCHILCEQCGDLMTSIDNCGKTALHLAAAAGHTAILQDLARAAPATCEAWDKDDRTPLHWAAATGHTSCARALLNMGVIPNPVDVDGVTPLEYASNAGHKDCVVLLKDRLGMKSNAIKNKQSQPKQSSGGFFKGLFSRKKDADRKKADIPSEAKLPEVFPNKKDRIISRNGFSDNEKRPGLDGSVNIKVTDVDTYNGSIVASHRELSIAKSREAGSRRKKKHKDTEDRDAGVSTPATYKSVSTWNDNSSHLSGLTELRTTHLSPLNGLRPPSISPRISQSPGLSSFDPVLKKRQGELTPLRMDRMMAERFEIPAPENMKSRDEERSTPSFTPHFNINGKSVLPDIHSGFVDTGPDQSNSRSNSERRRTEKKKKHKKKRRENGQSDTDIFTSSPHENDTDIYRPLDRGRLEEWTSNGLTNEIEQLINDKEMNSAVNVSEHDEMSRESEVITALTGMQF